MISQKQTPGTHSSSGVFPPLSIYFLLFSDFLLSFVSRALSRFFLSQSHRKEVYQADLLRVHGFCDLRQLLEPHSRFLVHSVPFRFVQTVY